MVRRSMKQRKRTTKYRRQLPLELPIGVVQLLIRINLGTTRRGTGFPINLAPLASVIGRNATYR